MQHAKLRKFLTPVLPGTCKLCGIVHKVVEPHRYNSLFYKYGFFDKYGRNPTPEDACAHCPSDIRARYLAQFKDKPSDQAQRHLLKIEPQAPARRRSAKVKEETKQPADDGQLKMG